MKKNTLIYLIVIWLLLTTVGSVLKIKHTSSADFFLGAGILTFVAGIALLVYRQLRKRSS
jgi:uncharacterized membrane protein HdeD (DUF308 family)